MKYYLDLTKISELESMQIQNYLFSEGYRWVTTGKFVKSYPNLKIIPDLKILINSQPDSDTKIVSLDKLYKILDMTDKKIVKVEASLIVEGLESLNSPKDDELIELIKTSIPPEYGATHYWVDHSVVKKIFHHPNVCDDWKNKIKKSFPEPFESEILYQVGQIFRCPVLNTYFMLSAVGIHENGIQIALIDNKGRRTTDHVYSTKLATNIPKSDIKGLISGYSLIENAKFEIKRC